MKQFQKLLFKPGINREGTNYSTEGFWWDCDRVRFSDGLPETIGGWVKHIATPFVGACRSLRSWVTLAGDGMLAVATSKKLYLETGGGLNDITPIRATFSETNPIQTGASGTYEITVTTTTAHGAVQGDYVTISGAAGVDGIPAGSINTEFAIASVPTTTTFTVVTSAFSTVGGVTGGGAGVSIVFQIGIGADSASIGSGWGVGAWSRGAWSSASAVPYSSYTNLRIWALANYGEDLIAAPFGLGMYYWDATLGTTARAVLLSTLGGASGVPPAVGFAFVTGERHVVALGATDIVSGAYDPMLIRWASQEALADWTPSTTNTSGDFRLSAGDHIEGFASTRDETLIFTDSAMYSMRYTGAPYVFDIRQVADNISCVGPNAVITANNVTYWMGTGKFYLYNGTSQTIPCSVHGHVFNDVNRAQARQVCAALVEQHSEIWWFYPSAASDTLDKYVVFNYADNIWYVGSLGRTAWTRAVSSQEQIAASDDGYLYVQEFGVDDGSTTPASSLNSFIESSDFDIQDGTSHYFVERIVPDMRFDRSTAPAPEVIMTLRARDFPGQAFQTSSARSVVRTSSIPVDQYTTEAWTRVRGRQLSLRVETDANETGTAWQLGNPRISARTDGRR